MATVGSIATTPQAVVPAGRVAGGGAGRRCGALRLHRRAGVRVRGLRAGIGRGAARPSFRSRPRSSGDSRDERRRARRSAVAGARRSRSAARGLPAQARRSPRIAVSTARLATRRAGQRRAGSYARPAGAPGQLDHRSTGPPRASRSTSSASTTAASGRCSAFRSRAATRLPITLRRSTGAVTDTAIDRARRRAAGVRQRAAHGRAALRRSRTARRRRGSSASWRRAAPSPAARTTRLDSGPAGSRGRGRAGSRACTAPGASSTGP